MADEYKLKVGVDLDFNDEDIQAGLNKVRDATLNNVGINFDRQKITKEINAINNQIKNTLGKKTIDLKLDSRNVHRHIRDIISHIDRTMEPIPVSLYADDSRVYNAISHIRETVNETPFVCFLDANVKFDRDNVSKEIVAINNQIKNSIGTKKINLKFDTSRIHKKITDIKNHLDKINGFDVKVNTIAKLDTSSFADLKNDIRTAKDISVKVGTRFDRSEFKEKVREKINNSKNISVKVGSKLDPESFASVKAKIEKESADINVKAHVIDTVTGENLVVDTRANVTDAVAGDKIVVDAKANVIDSVAGDKVIVDAKANVIDTVAGDNVIVDAKANVIDTVTGDNVVVDGMVDVKGTVPGDNVTVDGIIDIKGTAPGEKVFVDGMADIKGVVLGNKHSIDVNANIIDVEQRQANLPDIKVNATIEDVDGTNTSNSSNLDNIKQNIEEIGEESGLARTRVESFADALTKITSIRSDAQVRNIRNGMEHFGFSEIEIDKFVADIKEVDGKIHEITTLANDEDGITITIKAKDDASGKITTIVKNVKEVEKDGNVELKISGYTKITEKLDDVENKANKIADSFTSLSKKVISAKDGISGLAKTNQEAKDAAERLEEAYARLNNEIYNKNNAGKTIDGKLIEYDPKNLIKASQDVEKELLDISNLTNDIQMQFGRLADPLKKLTLKNKIELWLKENSAASEMFEAELRELQKELDDTTLSARRFQEIMSRVDNIKLEAKTKGVDGLDFLDSLKKKAKEYGTYFISSMSIFEVVQGIRYMADAVIEVDKAMTGLRRVTDLTATQYDVMYDKMIKSSKEYGRTLTDTINATSDWVKAGFDNADVALRLSEITAMYQNVSDLDYDESSENLITAYNGFKKTLMEAYNGDVTAAVEHIADVYNEIDNQFSVTSAGLGEGISRAASALELAGNTFEESVAMIGAVTEVTQDPEKAGSAMKILSLRLRGMKGELEEMGEEVDDDVENISKMQGHILNLTHGKVNIFDNVGDFRSTYDIMVDIAEVYDDLSQVEQADLLETIAGKHRANDVAALIQNIGNAIDMVETANNAAGSASEENAKYVDSLEGRINKLTAAFQALSTTVLDSDGFKAILSMLTKATELIEFIVKNLGTIGTIGLGVGVFESYKKRDGIKGALLEISSLFTETDKKAKGFGNTAKNIFGRILGSPSSIIGVVGVAASVIGLVTNLIKNWRKEQAEARRETIDTSNAFLDSADSFEKAYIKYSGKTSLTTEEESELESAIKGTVTALDDKSSALQRVVDGSNDYLESLEAIAEEELKAAHTAADKKKEAARGELESAVRGDVYAGTFGSEVNVVLSSQNDDVERIAREVGKNYFMTDGGNQYTGATFALKLPANASADEIIDYYYTLTELQQKLSEANLEGTAEFKRIDEVIKSLSESVKLYTDGIYDAAKAQYQLANGIPKTIDEYLKMREAILNSEDIKNASIETKKIVLGNLDSEYLESYDLSDEDKIRVQSRSLIGVIDKFSNEHANQFEYFLKMRTSVNDNDCSIGEYLSSFSNIENMLANSSFSEEELEEIRITFGLDSDSVKKQYEELIKDVGKLRDKEELEDILSNLTIDELAAAYKLHVDGDIEWDTISTDELLKEIKDEAEYIAAMRFTINIESETEGIADFNTAINEARSATGLTAESITALKIRYRDLEGYDAAFLFEETANGVTLNAEAVKDLEKAYAEAQLSKTTKAIDDLKDKYYSLGEEIDDCEDAARKAELIRERDSIRLKISELGELANMYVGLTSAYNEWQNAESASTNRDMYTTVHSAMEGIEEELSLGWIDDATREYFELIWGDNWDSAGKYVQDYRNQWSTLDDAIAGTSYSLLDFFKTDEDGNLTSKGIFNFFDAVLQKQTQLKNDGLFSGEDWITTDEYGNMVSFNFGLDGSKAVADALGISEELVQIFLRASQDAGFVVNFEGTYSQLADLQNDAVAAVDTLNQKFDTSYSFDFDSKSITTLQGELAKAKEAYADFWDEDGNFKSDMEGAQEAMTVISTLQATIDNLDNKYIGLTVQDEDFEESLTKLQDYESTVAAINQLKLNPEVNADKIRELELQLANIVNYFYNLSDEEKVELGIGVDASAYEIRQMIENGEITIPTTLDLQMNMNNTLEELRDVALLTSGLLSEEQEIEIMTRLGFKVEDEPDVSEVEENAEETAEEVAKELDPMAGLIEGIDYGGTEVSKSGFGIGALGSSLKSEFLTMGGNITSWTEDIFTGENAFIKQIPDKVKEAFISLGDTPFGKFISGNSIGQWIEDTFTGENSFIKQIPGKVKEAFISLWDTPFGKFISDNSIGQWIENTIENIKQIPDKVKEFFASLGDTAFGKWFSDNSIGQWIEDTIENIKQIPNKVKEFFASLGDTAFGKWFSDNSIGQWIEDTIEKIKQIPGKVSEFFTSLGDTAFGKWFSSTSVGQWVEGVIEDIKQIPDKVNEFFVSLGDTAFGKWFSDNSIGQWIEDTIEKIKQIPGKVSEFFTSLGDTAFGEWFSDNSIGQWIEDTIEKIKQIPNNIKGFFTSLGDTVFGEWFSDNSIGQWIEDTFIGENSIFKKIGTGISEWAKNFNLTSVLTTFTTNILTWISNTFTGENSIFKKIGTGISEWAGSYNIGTALETFKTNFSTWISNTFTGENSIFKQIGDGISEIFTGEDSIFSNISDGIVEIFTGEDSIFTKITNGIKSYFGDILYDIGEEISNIPILGEIGQVLMEKGEALKIEVAVAEEESGSSESNAGSDSAESHVETTPSVSTSSGFEESVSESAEDEFGQVVVESEVVVVPSNIDFSNKDSILEYDDATIETFFTTPGLKDNIQDVESFQAFVEGLDSDEVEILMNMPGFEGYFTDAETFKTIVESLDNETYETFIEPLGLETALSSASDFRTLVNQLDDNEIQVLMKMLGVKDGTIEVQELSGSIDDVTGKTVEVGVDTSGEEEKVTGLQSTIDNLKGKTVTITAQIKEAASNLWNRITGGDDGGGSGADGTAYVNGTAFADGTIGRAFKQGSWGIKGSGTALVGELGQELLVRDGRFYTIGDNGAEFIKYKPNDIIFNAGQTKQLFEQGKIVNGKTRGRAIASGTAFAMGRAFGDNGSIPPSEPDYPGSGWTVLTSSSSKKSSGGSADEFLEIIDWIETAIDRIERAISRLDLKASSTFKKWTTRNSALVDEISLIRDEIDLQTAAYNRYLQEANSIGLSDDYAKKVRDGKIDIESIADEGLKEQIDEYQEW